MNNLFRFSLISNDTELRTVVAKDQKSASEKTKVLFPTMYPLIKIIKKDKFLLP